MRSERLALSRGVGSDLTVGYMSGPYNYTIKVTGCKEHYLLLQWPDRYAERKFHLGPHKDQIRHSLNNGWLFCSTVGLFFDCM